MLLFYQVHRDLVDRRFSLFKIRKEVLGKYLDRVYDPVGNALVIRDVGVQFIQRCSNPFVRAQVTSLQDRWNDLVLDLVLNTLIENIYILQLWQPEIWLPLS
jgi:hypothetical protein